MPKDSSYMDTNSKLPYQNPSLSAEARTADLLSRMTLEEKAAQMMCVWNEKATKLLDEKGNFDEAKAKQAFADGHGIGQVGRPSDAGLAANGRGLDARQMAELTNRIQKFFMENSRLGIPVIFHEECLHGEAAVDGTSFPQPIALGGTFNPQLVEDLYTMTAEETRVRGGHQALTPVVDVAREPRWGRVEETYGEDTYLAGVMGTAAVKGFQGDASFQDGKHVIATLKHFAAHGQPESGMNCGPVNVSLRVLRETFLAPFKKAIQEGGAISIMASYNEIDGVPSHASTWLLRDVLRKEWGFEGFVVSDYYAIWELGYRPDTHGHFVAANNKEACQLAVEAGVNIEFPEPDCYLHIIELVKEGKLKEAMLDELVRPMLLWKFKLGLFEKPYVDPEHAAAVVGRESNRALALKAAQQAITLLKNEPRLLPLTPGAHKTVAVIGPNANRSLLGGYSGTPKQETTVLAGIEAALKGKAKVVYSEGCQITVNAGWSKDAVELPSEESDRKQIAEAVEVAKNSDLIILAIGGNEQTSRESWALNHMGDRVSLDLFGRQQELVDAMVATGKPVVALLFHGRPLSVNKLVEQVPAILDCWYLGQEGGTAVAQALFGEINPSGKLPISYPRSAGHIPAYYNYRPSARRGYLDAPVTPLFAFGYGLSYTSFAFGKPRLEQETIAVDGATKVLVDVTNTGKVAGEEVVQMYVRDLVSSTTRPIRELKGFAKISLEPGETKTVPLAITAESLAFFDVHYNYTVEPGDFEIQVGNSSRDADLQKVILHVQQK
jgi:beta-glucosidase